MMGYFWKLQWKVPIVATAGVALLDEWVQFAGPLVATLALSSFLIYGLDFVTGVYASWVEGKPITSDGFRKSIHKFVSYTAAVLLAFLLDALLKPLGFSGFALQTFIFSSIVLTEATSVVENLRRINPDLELSAFQQALKALTKFLEKTRNDSNHHTED